MGKLLTTILLTLLLANSLAVLGLLGYGLTTGRFDSELRAQYLATWRGEKLVEPSPEEEVVAKKETPQQASARIAEAQFQREVLTREIQRDIELARSMQQTVAQAKVKLDKDIQQLQTDKLTFEDQLTKHNEKVQSEGFKKSLQAYSKMKPKSAKSDFMQMSDAEAVQYLANMKPDVVTQILDQFRTPEELDKRLKLMKLLEKHGTISLNQNQTVEPKTQSQL
jgi:flagellar motility protein MotE (MotC chaperone)